MHQVQGIQVGRCRQAGAGDAGYRNVDVLEVAPDQEAFGYQGSHLGRGGAVADDQVVGIQEGQVDQVADVDDLGQVLEKDLVGADVVVQIAVLEEAGIFQVANIELETGIGQVSVIEVAFLDQGDQVDPVILERDQAVQWHGGDIGIVDVDPELGLERGNVELDIIEIEPVDEIFFHVFFQGHVIEDRTEQGVDPDRAQVHVLVKLAVLEQGHQLRVLHDHDRLEVDLFVDLVDKGVGPQNAVQDHLLEGTVWIEHEDFDRDRVRVARVGIAVVVGVGFIEIRGESRDDILLADHVGVSDDIEVHHDILGKVGRGDDPLFDELAQGDDARFPEVALRDKPGGDDVILGQRRTVQERFHVDAGPGQPGIGQRGLTDDIRCEDVAQEQFCRRQVGVGDQPGFDQVGDVGKAQIDDWLEIDKIR